MSTDPREFEHPIDGTTPNELPTVLGVGSLTTEAIEAAARALWERERPLTRWDWLVVNDSVAAGMWQDRAAAALTAAAPFIAAQAKVEALREAAEAYFSMSPEDWMQFHRENPHGGVGRTVAEAWLRARAATITVRTDWERAE